MIKFVVAGEGPLPLDGSLSFKQYTGRQLYHKYADTGEIYGVDY
jgi:hypothetical protein